jgi:murein DD-endopeptidase MepM/ murein hydrolase activator NlpD
MHGLISHALVVLALWAAMPISWVSTGVAGQSEDPVLDAVEVSFEIPAEEFHLVFPQDAAVTRFDSTYGAGKEDGRRHQGNDLMAPKMTPVYAVSDGVVIRAATTPRAGSHIWIDHGNGWTSWYMHLNNDTPGTDNGRAARDETFAPGIEAGAFVVAGQVIGFVGDSGNAEGTESHTHFELHKDGRSVNPYSYLTEAYERALLAIKAQRLAEVLPVLD